jgi:putative peptidoglycan lipid II flippase
MSVAVLISRLLGLFRDIIFAAFFGASYIADAFNVGYQIPNLLRKLFGEGALSAAFIPIYNDIDVKKGRAEQIDFALNILSLLTLLLTILSLLGMVFAPLIVKLIAPGFSAETYELTIKLTRIMFPYLLLIGLSSTLISILNSHDFFFIPGLSSAMLNLGMIVFLLVFSILYDATPEDKVSVLAYGVLFGGILQTAVNLPLLKKIGYRLSLNFNLRGKAIKSLWQRFLPGVAGLAIREVNLVADIILASFLISGSIAALQYGNRLMQLPLGIFGISAASAVLPLFSRYISAQQWDKLSSSLRFSIVTLCYIMIPITAIIVGLGKDIIRLIFMRGAFDQFALDMSYRALLFYSLGLLFYSLNRTIIPIFFANKDTKTPVIISALIVGLNIILNIILMQFLQHAGLALASSLSAFIHFLILMKVLKKKLPQIAFGSVTRNIFMITMMSSLILGMIVLSNIFFSAENFLQLLIKVAIYLTVIPIFYYLGTNALKVEYIDKIAGLLWKK